MIDSLYLHTSGTPHDILYSVDEPWKHNIRSQILCRNQEEHDYLSSLNLMHGREIQIDIWDEWLKSRKPYMSLFEDKTEIKALRPKLLPIAYTTWPANLRGY